MSTDYPLNVHLTFSDDGLKLMAVEINGRHLRSRDRAEPIVVLARAPTDAERVALVERFASDRGFVGAILAHPVGAEIDVQTSYAPRDYMASHRQMPPIPITMPPTRDDRTPKGQRRFPDPRRGRW